MKMVTRNLIAFPGSFLSKILGTSSSPGDFEDFKSDKTLMSSLSVMYSTSSVHGGLVLRVSDEEFTCLSMEWE